jgi:Kdo2-lipid IVA lauroyltransferase/acyltransferase
MNPILYYLILYPLSKLPLWISYRFADVFYLMLISILPYRKKVINSNLAKSFPDRTVKEIKQLRNDFYWNFSTMLIEGVKNLGISEKELRKRFVIKNPELMNDLFKKNKSVVLVSAHYANWEWMITGQNLFFKHQAVGIGMPLSSGFFDKKINGLRQRFGMHVTQAREVDQVFEGYKSKNTLFATLVLADQAPGNSLKSYWTNFLNQKTAVAFGPEQLANKYDQAVVFYIPKSIKRGYYEVELELLCENPKDLSWGEITEIHTRKLEQILTKKPAPWLWSHKRWKREVPTSLEQLKREQREKFNRTFRS